MLKKIKENVKAADIYLKYSIQGILNQGGYLIKAAETYVGRIKYMLNNSMSDSIAQSRIQGMLNKIKEANISVNDKRYGE